MITVSVQSDKWFDAVQAKANQLKLTVEEVNKDEARLFVGTMINLTPPTRGRGPAGTANPKMKVQAVGEASAKRDVLKSMTPADPDWQDGYKFLRNKRIRDVVLKGDVKAFTAILQNMGKFRNWRVETFSPQLHQRAQNSRGQVRRTQKIFIIGAGQLAEYWLYLRKVLSHVGRLKAGWLPAFFALGGRRVPAFVSRHKDGARGTIRFERQDTWNPKITVTNSAMGVGQLEGIVNNTFRARVEAIKRRMKLVARAFAKGTVEEIKSLRQSHGSIEAT